MRNLVQVTVTTEFEMDTEVGVTLDGHAAERDMEMQENDNDIRSAVRGG